MSTHNTKQGPPAQQADYIATQQIPEREFERNLHENLEYHTATAVDIANNMTMTTTIYKARTSRSVASESEARGEFRCSSNNSMVLAITSWFWLGSHSYCKDLMILASIP